MRGKTANGMKKTVFILLFLSAAVLRAQEVTDTVLFKTGLEDMVAALKDTTDRVEKTAALPDTTVRMERPATPRDTTAREEEPAALPLFTDASQGPVIPGKPVEKTQDFGGITWYTYDFDGVLVSAGVRLAREYGHYYLVDLHILNTTKEPLSFDFGGVRMSTESGGVIPVYTYESYMRRIRGRQGWAHFGVQLALLPLRFIAIALTDHAFDDDDSFGRSLAEGLAGSMIDAAADIGSVLIASRYGAEAERILEQNLGYMRSCRILPDSSVRGHFFARFDSHAREIHIDIPLNGTVRRLTFLAVGLPLVNPEEAR